MHILFAGGGTAGHINPALAIAGYIKQKHPDAEISYIGTAKKLEARLVPACGYKFYTIDVAGFQRKISVKNIGRNVSAAVKAVTSSIKARQILKEIKPDLVIGTGGYVSGPVVREAQRLGIPTAIHEQNAYPGVTTKMVAEKTNCVMLAMPEAKKYLKLHKAPVITGNPVRQSLTSVNREYARNKLGVDDSTTVILSFGGSLGARRINEAVQSLVRDKNGKQGFYIIHGTGSSGYDAFVSNLADVNLQSNIDVREYIEDMDICLAAADLVICRAGAITLTELQVCGKAAILIPSPYVAENHQFHNAMTLKNANAAELIEEKDLTGETLINKVDELVKSPEILKNMAQNARKHAILDTDERIYNAIIKLIK